MDDAFRSNQSKVAGTRKKRGSAVDWVGTSISSVFFLSLNHCYCHVLPKTDPLDDDEIEEYSNIRR
jgi:hypothetical protein